MAVKQRSDAAPVDSTVNDSIPEADWRETAAASASRSGPGNTGSGISLVPFCVVKRSDHDALAPLFRIFRSPEAVRAGLRGVIQAFDLSPGSVQPAGDPILLTGAIAPREQEAGKIRQSLRQTWRHNPLVGDMLYVTSRRLWLVLLPRVALMQADDIRKEIDAIASGLTRDLRNSTWARCSIATLRMAPPVSAHDKLSLLGQAHRALEILAEQRPDALRAAQAAGYHLADFRLEDLDRAIADG